MASAEPIDGRCGAVVKPKPEQGREGGFCEKAPLVGQLRCGTHGGKAPQALAAAERRQQEVAAREAVATFGLRRDVGFDEAILEEFQWAAGHVAWLRGRVQELTPDALVWGVTSEIDKGAGEFPGVDTTSGAEPNVWLVEYRKERQHLLALYVAAKKAGAEDARLRIAEREGARIAEVIRRSFDRMLDGLVALGLGQALVERWPELMREVVVVELRALGTEPGA